MVSDACVIGGEYEPESYQEMRDDLNKLFLKQEKLFKGFYPSEWSIASDINYLYSEDIDDCPFCFVERKGDVVIFKTESEYNADRLFEDLENKKQWRIFNIEKMGLWKFETPWIIHDPMILKIKKHPATEKKEFYAKITCSYWMLKPLLKKSILDKIENHKEFMNEMRSEYDDAPLQEDDFQVQDLKEWMKGAYDSVNCGGDCNLLIDIYSEEIKRLEKLRIELPNDRGQITFER